MSGIDCQTLGGRWRVKSRLRELSRFAVGGIQESKDVHQESADRRDTAVSCLRRARRKSGEGTNLTEFEGRGTRDLAGSDEWPQKAGMAGIARTALLDQSQTHQTRGAP